MNIVDCCLQARLQLGRQDRHRRPSHNLPRKEVPKLGNLSLLHISALAKPNRWAWQGQRYVNQWVGSRHWANVWNPADGPFRCDCTHCCTRLVIKITTVGSQNSIHSGKFLLNRYINYLYLHDTLASSLLNAANFLQRKVQDS